MRVFEKNGAWFAEWRQDEHGVRRVRRLAMGSSRTAAERAAGMIAELVRARELGVDPPERVEKWVKQSIGDGMRVRLAERGLVDERALLAVLPLTRHLEEFERHLRGMRLSDVHVQALVSRTRRLVDGCGFTTYRELAEGAVKIREWLNAEHDPDGKNVAAQTLNHYVASVLRFCAWMKAEGRAATAPKLKRGMFTVAEDRRRERFSFSDVKDFQKLLDAAWRRAEVDERMDGPTRAVCWWFTVETGLRLSEVGRVCREHIDDASGMMVVRVSKTKRAGGAEQLVQNPELVRMVRQLMARKMPGVPLFPVSKRTRLALWRDLAAAGLGTVSPTGDVRDEAGRVFDFHSLRYQAAELLLLNSPANAAVTEVMRHSDANLTVKRYARARMPQKRAVLEARPTVLAPDRSEHESGAASG